MLLESVVTLVIMTFIKVLYERMKYAISQSKVFVTEFNSRSIYLTTLVRGALRIRKLLEDAELKGTQETGVKHFNFLSQSVKVSCRDNDQTYA